MTAETLVAPRTASAATQKGCAAAAWDCQSHTFLGSPETVAANLAGLPDELVTRRVYMMMVLGDGRAEARLFERFDIEDRDGTVARWENDELGDMVSQITEVLVNNRGIHCPGEQVKASLEGDRDFIVDAPAPAPKTAAEAFGPALAAFKGDKFVQVTVMALC